MWVNTFKILTNTDAPEVVGNAYLFDTNFMVAEILEPYEDSDRSVIIKSGGQDGLLRWLEKNNYALEHKKIEQTTDLGKDVNIKLRMGLNEPITATLDDGSVVQTSGLQPWSINQPYSSMSLGKKIGQLTTSAFNEPWVMVVDGDIAAFMSMDSWKNPAYGITDYQGGGHNFWIPFMMSGGRSGAGYVMIMDLPPLQARLAVDAMKGSGKEADLMKAYVFGSYNVRPLPEFQDRMEWVATRHNELVGEDMEPESATQQTFNELTDLIRKKDTAVFDNSYTLEGGYVVEGQEYEWPKP